MSRTECPKLSSYGGAYLEERQTQRVDSNGVDVHRDPASTVVLATFFCGFPLSNRSQFVFVRSSVLRSCGFARQDVIAVCAGDRAEHLRSSETQHVDVVTRSR